MKTKKEKNQMNYPSVVSRAEWLAARKEFLTKEKEFTRLRDELSSQRRALPWEKVEKRYEFDSDRGKVTMAELIESTMQNQNFTTTLLAGQTPKEVFNAITNVRGWWSELIEGRTDQLNREFIHRDKYLYVKMKIIHLTPQKIVWDILESHNYEFLKHINEWNDTRIAFEINEKADKTEIRFTHVGLAPAFECYTACSNAWGFFTTTSLKNLIETGKGEPISKEYASFTTSITVDKSPEEVFEAVNNVRGWWLNNIEGRTDKLNEEFKFYVDERLQFHFRIIELIPYEKVVWLVLDQNFKVHEDKHEWRGTTVIFEISKEGSQTLLRFTHQGLAPQLECYDTCQNAWTKYIQISLFNFIQKGEGQPNKW